MAGLQAIKVIRDAQAQDGQAEECTVQELFCQTRDAEQEQKLPPACVQPDKPPCCPYLEQHSKGQVGCRRSKE